MSSSESDDDKVPQTRCCSVGAAIDSGVRSKQPRRVILGQPAEACTPGRAAGKAGSDSDESDKERGGGEASSDQDAGERPTAAGKSISAMSSTGASAEGNRTGLSDDSDEEAAPTPAASEGAARKKVVDDESEEETANDKMDEDDSVKAPAQTGLSDSDSDGEAQLKKKSSGGGDGGGDTEMADNTHKEISGDSDSDDQADAGESSNKHKGQKVILNKETGQLERGPVEDAPEHAINDSQVGRDKRVISKESLKLSIPALPRPQPNARLFYVNPPKRHLMLDHAPFTTVEEEAKKIAAAHEYDSYYQSATAARWRYTQPDDDAADKPAWLQRGKESNARFVEWSDGSMTLHVGNEVLQVKKEVLENNSHHLFVKHSEAKVEGEAPHECAIIESHGVLEARMVIKKTEHKTGRKILATVSKQYGKKQLDKDSIFVRNHNDDASLAAQEAARIRNESRKEGARRRAGASGEMNEDFLENDIDGDVGGYLARSKRQRRGAGNTAALRKAKAAKQDSDSDPSSDSSDAAPARSAAKRTAASSSSSSSSSSSDEGGAPIKKAAAPPSSRKAVLDSSSDSD